MTEEHKNQLRLLYQSVKIEGLEEKGLDLLENRILELKNEMESWDQGQALILEE